jgi:acyl-CoA reductase-like NAD-dependent aldehyde dehydrogenase
MDSHTGLWARRQPWRALDFTRRDESFVHASGPAFDSTDPATGDGVATLPSSTSDDLDAAVELARRAFGTSRRATDGALRARVLFGFAQALRSRRDDLAELLTREQGKTIHESQIELDGSAEMVEYYAGLARAVYGRSTVLGPNITGVITRRDHAVELVTDAPRSVARASAGGG